MQLLISFSLGGGVRLAGDIGCFGVLKHFKVGEEILLYICRRGDVRESYWMDYAAKVDTKAKGKTKAAKVKVDPQIGFSLPIEPDGSNVDPNHGPGSKFWKRLLEVVSDDDYSSSKCVTLLLASMMNRVELVTHDIIAKGVSTNTRDDFGFTPLMYALLFRREDLLHSLLNTGADVDSFSLTGEPMIKFVFIVAELLELENPIVFNSRKSWRLHYCDAQQNLEYILRVISSLIERNIDLKVSDKGGNGPLHYALGMVKTEIEISGMVCLLDDFVYPEESKSLKILLSTLCNGGADPNACNKDGICPLHIVASLADVDAMEYLFSQRITPNPMDCNRYHPLHYLCGAARNKALAGFQILLTNGSFRPIDPMSYKERYLSIPKHERDILDLDDHIQKSFAQAICPSILFKERLKPIELAGLTTNRKVNLLHLSLCGHLLYNEPFSSHAKSNKRIRLRLVDLFHKIEGFDPRIAYSYMENHGLTIHHAYSALFLEPMDTDFYPNRPKVKGRKPPSIEYEIIAYAMIHQPSTLYKLCNHEVDLLNPEIKEWTPLHAAIANKNSELISHIFRHGFEPTCVNYLHLAVKMHLPLNSVQEILQHILSTPDSPSVLNDSVRGFNTTPLHLAVRCQNVDFISLLSRYTQFSLIRKDDVSGLTAFYEAVLHENSSILKAFSDVHERVDLFLENTKGETCLEVAIRRRKIEAVTWLLDFRRSDCVQILLRESASGCSLLYDIEREHYELLKELKNAAIAQDEVHVITDHIGAFNLGKEVHSTQELSAQSQFEESTRILVKVLNAIHANIGFDIEHYHTIYSREEFDPVVFSS